MFKKLITNLPFNPSLLGQVSFYAKRLRREESVRRLGFGFMALAMFVQVFAVIVPPQKSLAYSPDYIAPDGFSTKTDVLAAWDNPASDIQAIYSRFGVTRDMVVNLSQPVTIYSNADNLWTTGRISLKDVSKSAQIQQKYKDSEFSVTVGTTPIYIRDLKAWDIVNPVNHYSAFEGVKADGAKFWILRDCGNFTQVGPPLQPITLPPSQNPLPPATPPPSTPPPLIPPALELRKTIDGGPEARKPGDQFVFRFEYRNSVPDSQPAQNVVLTDTLDLDHFDIVSPANLPLNGHVLSINLGTVAYSPNYQLAGTLTVRLKSNLANGQSICNAASLSSGNAPTVTSGGPTLCVTVINPCPLDSTVPSATDTRCTTPALVCSLTQARVNRTTKESTLVTTVTSSNPALTHVISYAYDFGDKSSKTNNSNSLTDTVKHVYADGHYSATATVTYRIGSDTKTNHTVTCAADVETKPDRPLAPSKYGRNITQNLSAVATTSTKASGGDVIEYAISVHNSFGYDRANYTVSDYIGDVLDYADVDLSYLKDQGGSFDDKAKTVVWANQTVKAKNDMVKKFRVTVKNPVPATNLPGAMASSFDCVIGNKYGDEVLIPINCPPAKAAEYITSTLPNTGPGTSIMIGAVLTVFIAYFFARSHLLGKELDLIRNEYAVGGGF